MRCAMRYAALCIMMFITMIVACATIPVTGNSATDNEINSPGPVYYGNIIGSITIADHRVPIKNALIYISEIPVRCITKGDPGAVFSDQGWVVIPEPSTGVCRSTSRDDGSFIINNIPIYGDSQLYTVVIEAKGLDTVVIDQVSVLPGASMALKIDCRMTSDGQAHIIKNIKDHRHVDVNYSDELKKFPKNEYRH